MASIRDPKEKMANQLLMRGHASMDEILQASYGEWPPKGLDIVSKNDQRVNLVSLTKMADDWLGTKPTLQRWWGKISDSCTVGGRGTISGERKIGINKGLCIALPRLWGGSDLNSTLGHEGVHILQGDHYWRAKEIFGHEGSQSIWRSQKDAIPNTLANEVVTQHESKNPLARAKSTFMAMGNKKYLQDGLEIQARIHEMMILGYEKWGRLPTNHEELYVALADAGLKAPRSVVDKMRESPTIGKTMAVFGGKVNAIFNQPSWDLGAVQSSLTVQGRDVFWEKTLPALYADLIEMYGDKQGRARFGLGVNTRADLRTAVAAEKAATAPQETAKRSTTMGTL